MWHFPGGVCFFLVALMLDHSLVCVCVWVSSVWWLCVPPGQPLEAKALIASAAMQCRMLQLS